MFLLSGKWFRFTGLPKGRGEKGQVNIALVGQPRESHAGSPRGCWSSSIDAYPEVGSGKSLVAGSTSTALANAVGVNGCAAPTCQRANRCALLATSYAADQRTSADAPGSC